MKIWQKILCWLFCLALPTGLIAWRILAQGVTLDTLVPWKGWNVQLVMRYDGHGDSVEIHTYLPPVKIRQHVWGENLGSAGSHSVHTDSSGDRIFTFSSGPVEGRREVLLEYSVLPERVVYAIDSGILIDTALPANVRSELDPTPSVQANDPEIAALLHRISPDQRIVSRVLRRVFDYASDSIRYRNFSGATDARTTMLLGEASCNGKARLMAALLRTAGIPSRLVGGMILNQGSKRTSHQWVEAWVAGYWVPFCPTNGYFAVLPEQYLELYHGDRTLFHHSANINFDFGWTIKSVHITKDEIGLGKQQLGEIWNLWSMFDKVGLGMVLLKTLLLVPVGGLITVVFRNLLGFEPFGTFLPALIATASQSAGLGWGLAAFFGVILLGAAVRWLVEGIKLTRTPKLAVILIAVVSFLLAMTWLGVKLNIPRLSHVSVFPLVVLTMTIERFSNAVVEDGLVAGLRRSLVTAIAISACYAVISLKSVQLLFVAFPEALLFVIGLNIWIGRWAGIRVWEYWRFRELLITTNKEVRK